MRKTTRINSATQTNSSHKESSPKPSDAGSTVVAALETAVDAVRKDHPDLPPVFVTLANGYVPDWGRAKQEGEIAARGLPAKWKDKRDGTELWELEVASVVLGQTARTVFHLLLRLLAPLPVFLGGEQPFARQGRYYNEKWKEAAELLGLSVTRDDVNGFSWTELTEQVEARYAKNIADLERGLVAYRIEQHGEAAPAQDSDHTSDDTGADDAGGNSGSNPQRQSGEARGGTKNSGRNMGPIRRPNSGSQADQPKKDPVDGGKSSSRNGDESKPVRPPKDGVSTRGGDDKTWVTCECECEERALRTMNQIQRRSGALTNPSLVCPSCSAAYHPIGAAQRNSSTPFTHAPIMPTTKEQEAA